VTESLLSVESLTVTYGGVRALDDVDFDVLRGSLTGLIGPNGAGKTTFIDAVSGLTSSRGRVTFDGHDLENVSASGRARLGLARTFQSLELFEDITVRENLLVSAESARWWAPVLEIVRPVRQPRATETTERALALLGLEGLADALPTSLSLGQRKLVTVARALAARPKLILLDEPAAGLDSDESLEFGERLGQLTREGITIVLVDHDVGLVLRVCDRIHVFEFGRLLTTGTPAEISSNDKVIRSYLGEEASELAAMSEPA
jgi:ABC-type branched-subunit amino acid transport system ATPase component